MSNITPIFQLNKQIFTDGDMSDDLTSEILDLGEVSGYAVHYIWTGSPAGNLIVSGSNTENLNDFVVVDTHAAGGAAGKYMFNLPISHYRYVLVQFVNTSGSGVLNCYVSGKRG